MSANRKTLTCRCGRRVLVGAEAEAARCSICTAFIGDPKAGGGRSPDTPHLGDVKECANFVGQGCIVRERGRCVVLEGGRCGWYEKAVRPGGGLSGRICAGCGGEVPKRRRYCEACRRARRRATFREAQRRKRVPCQQLAAPTPLNCQESEAAQGTFREGRPGVAAHAQSVDMGEDGPGVCGSRSARRAGGKGDRASRAGAAGRTRREPGRHPRRGGGGTAKAAERGLRAGTPEEKLDGPHAPPEERHGRPGDAGRDDGMGRQGDDDAEHGPTGQAGEDGFERSHGNSSGLRALGKNEAEDLNGGQEDGYAQEQIIGSVAQDMNQCVLRKERLKAQEQQGEGEERGQNLQLNQDQFHAIEI